MYSNSIKCPYPFLTLLNILFGLLCFVGEGYEAERLFTVLNKLAQYQSLCPWYVTFTR